MAARRELGVGSWELGVSSLNLKIHFMFATKKIIPQRTPGSLRYDSL